MGEIESEREPSLQRSELEQLRQKLVTKFERDVLALFDRYERHGNRFADDHSPDTTQDQPRYPRSGRKEFKQRESVLTVMLQKSKSIRTIYNIFLALAILIFLNTFVNDTINGNSTFLNFRVISWNFGRIQSVFLIWLCLFLSTVFVVFPTFSNWVHSRVKNPAVDPIYKGIYVCYMVVFLIVPAYLVRSVYELPPASTLIVVLEQIRLGMKTHSFVRENLPREDSNPRVPPFENYLYFLFAPTLLYRDEYPRTKSIDWSFVKSCFVQVLACIVFFGFIFARFIFPVFRDFGKQEFDVEHFVQCVFNSVLPGTMLLLVGHFMILHCWLNAWAEMLRFGDRVFYREWWTSTNFGEFYRTWNVVVHDWLKAYILYDIPNLFPETTRDSPRTRMTSLAGTFVISALVHEYVIVMAAGFFYPILLFLFLGVGFGFMLAVQSNTYDSFQNTMFWFFMTIGMGVLMCLYSQEWYAHINCPHDGSRLLDYLIPRSLACHWPIQA